MIDIIDISDTGWKPFFNENHGHFIVRCNRRGGTTERYIARVYISDSKDRDTKELESKTFWMVDRIGSEDVLPCMFCHDPDDEDTETWMTKEAFFPLMNEKYPEDLTRLLFQEEWFE